jgi:hypothetical protein
MPTLEAVVWLPVEAGLWTQRELFDGTYTVDDLFDALEFITVREENQRRAAACRARKEENV